MIGYVLNHITLGISQLGKTDLEKLKANKHFMMNKISTQLSQKATHR